MIRFSVRDVRTAVSQTAFERGLEYQRKKRVATYKVQDGGSSIVAKTRGSDPVPYVQHISLYPVDGKVDVDGTCTCPVSVDCKHVVAVLLTVLAERAAEMSGPPGASNVPSGQALPDHISLWLKSIDAAQRMDADHPAHEQAVRVMYLLTADMQLSDGLVPFLSVRPVSARINRDGTFTQQIPAIDVGVASRPAPPRYLLREDFWIFRQLSGISWSDGDQQLTGEHGAETLKRILATGRARFESVNSPALSEGPERNAQLVWRVQANGDQSPAIDVEGGAQPVRLSPPWYIDAGAGVAGPLKTDVPAALTAALLEAPDVPKLLVERVREEIERRLKGVSVALPRVLATAEKLKVKPICHLRLFSAKLPARNIVRDLHAGTTTLSGVAELSYRYGPVRIDRSVRAKTVQVAHEDRLYAVERDLQQEQKAEALLEEHGLVHAQELFGWGTPSQHRGHYVLEDDSEGMGWADFLYHSVPDMEAAGWVVEVDSDFPWRLAQHDGTVDAQLKEGSGIDWFDLELGVQVDGVRVDLVPMLLRFLRRQGGAGEEPEDSTAPLFLKMDDGRVLALPAERLRPVLTALAGLFRNERESDDARGLRFSLFDAGELAAFEEATAKAGVAWRGGEALRTLGQRLRQVDGVPKVPVPRSFKAKLRAYQQRGVDWLQFLREVGLGGVLADDMGLGKTVQTLAHLVIEQKSGRMDRPALIVCPTSLVANWHLEAKRFAPSLSVLTLHGASRKSRFEAIADHDVVITTYPLLSRDHEVLTRQPWHVAILDEAQMIKNPDALTAKLAGKLEARQRLCLSGTPVENHLGELWSLFSFAAPGFLGERSVFNRRYRQPIEKQGDTVVRAALAARVRPFILRRTKDAVLSDLPPKTEIPEAVELNEGQRALYEAIRLTMQARVRQAIASSGLAGSQITILDALLKLRQVCCDPRLVRMDLSKTRKNVAAAGSAKLERVMEMVPAMIAERRRILLFSQFTSMLALIEKALGERGISYALLTGDTRDRSKPVEQFQSGKVDLFLISLKAGGQGLNLTAADTVILYDPWWNPAVEDQAAGRAHRMGQTKPVFVHKLMTVGTIEEKMEELKSRKRDLVAGILDGALGTRLSLSASDVEALFAPV